MTVPSIQKYAVCTRPDWTVTDGPGSALTLTKKLAADEPYLSGHYPGNPVYPGVFQLDLCYSLLREWFGPDSVVTAIESIRFVKPAHPGDSIRISATNKPARSRRDSKPGYRRIQFVGCNQDDAKLFTVLAEVRES